MAVCGGGGGGLDLPVPGGVAGVYKGRAEGEAAVVGWRELPVAGVGRDGAEAIIQP